MDLIAVYPRSISSRQGNAANVSNKAAANTDYAYENEDEEELNVDVYRLNGQKVFTTTIEVDSADTGITDVAWREDGIILAITTSDNRIRLVDTFSGKAVHTFSSVARQSPQDLRQNSDLKNDASLSGGKRKSLIEERGPRKRQCTPMFMHYSTHLSNPDTTRTRLAAIHEENGRVLDDLLSLHADLDDLLKLEADLPKELANLDVEQYLPKLATLPASGVSEDAVFSTRLSIDSLLHAGKQNTRSSGTDIVTIARNDANIHVRIFDSFEIGDVDLNAALNLPTDCVLGDARSIITHPFSPKVYALAEEQLDNSSTRSRKAAKSGAASVGRLHLLSLDLRFLQQSALGLPILATKATQLHNLIRYLRQIEQQLSREVKSAFDLPSRFVRTLEEDLKEQDGEGSTFQTSAYHALLVGEVTGKFKEWLVDVLGDRGVKRWEKAVAECLDNVRRLMNESWLPAVERAGVVVSRLSGLSASDTFRIDKTILEGLRNTVDVMAIVGEDLVREVNVEIAGFAAFITWLKREVEAASLEDTSEKLEELRENSDHSEVRKVLKYISQRLQDTAVKKYIHDEHGLDGASGDTADDLDFYKEFCEARKTTKKQSSQPTMKLLVGRLRGQCDRLFRQVAQQLQENVVVEHICILDGRWSTKILDCRIVYQGEHAVLNVFAVDSESRGALWIAQRPLDQAKATTKTTRIVLEHAGEILDIKCADDEMALALVQVTKAIKVLSIRLQVGLEPEVNLRHEFGGVHDNFTKLGLSPWRMDVNGRKGRRTMTILDKQGRGYGVFDLDSATDASNRDEVMSG